MKERSILFSSPMARAILEGRKTMTRRVIKLDEFSESTTPGYDFAFRKRGLWHDVRLADMLNPPRRNYPVACPYGTIGDRLWVKETHHVRDAGYVDGTGRDIVYKADDEDFPYGWTPSIHMPRWASRITLEITGIRVERVWDITRDDAMDEGVERVDPYSITPDLPPGMQAAWKDYSRHGWVSSPVFSFRTLWDSINSKRAPWASNPWVWVIEFGRAK